MFPLVSAIVTAKPFIRPSTGSDGLEKIILKQMEHPVKHIVGLEPLLKLMRAGGKAVDYFYPLPSEISDSKEIFARLKEKKHRIESQMQRLQSLYLHGADAISESDYISERSKLSKELAVVDKNLSDMSDADEMISEEFVLQASALIMIDKLMNYSKGSSQKLLSTIDPRVPKHFLNAVISRIVLTDGNITEVTFKNKVSIGFEY